MRPLAALMIFATLAAVSAGGEPFDLGASVGGPAAPDGTPAQVDVPKEWHLRNKGGNDRTPSNPFGQPGKGSGLCVFTSIEHAARMQGVEALVGFRDWMTNRPGGGYPDKVDRMIEEICRERGVAKPRYLHVEGLDLSLLKVACRNRRVPGVTYGFSPSGRYGGQKISHMVSLVHADENWFAVLDNNYPGNYEWLTPAEFKDAWTFRISPPFGPRLAPQGWAVILLSPGPPPTPLN